MVCGKCQLLDVSGAGSEAHSDLVHVRVRFFKARHLSMLEARRDEFECKVCGTRWEQDFDPTEAARPGALRRAAEQ